MKVGRNDPCPCGSGKKYKKCCLPLDREAGVEVSAAGAIRRAAVESRDWEVDVVPVPGELRGDPEARLAVLFVVAQGLGIHSEALNRLSPEPEGMAEALAKGVRDAAAKFGRFPERVLVREEVVAEELTSRLPPCLGEEGRLEAPPRAEAARLDGLDEMVYSFLDDEGPYPGRVRVAATEAWAAWGLPEALVERILRAAASLFRDDPWRVLDDTEPVGVATPSGSGWTVLAIGRRHDDAALILFSDPRDYERILTEVDEETGFNDLDGRVLDLAFDPAEEAPRVLRREVESSAPELVEDGICPRLLTFNTPAGGVRLADAEDLASVLEALPRFVVEHEEILAEDAERERPPIEAWADEKTGLELSWYPVVWLGDDEWNEPDDLYAYAYPYDPDVPPDPAEWLELSELEQIDAVDAAHTGTLDFLEEGRARVHAVLQAAVETQIASGDPETVPGKLEELMGDGLTRHEALHALMSVLATLTWEISKEELRDPDVITARHLELLAELTAESWLETAEEPPE